VAAMAAQQRPPLVNRRLAVVKSQKVRVEELK
jgi:hypothetical protein